MTTELVVAGALAFPTYARFSWHTEPPAAPIRALRAALLAALPPPPPPPCEGGVLLALREERDVDNWDEAARALRAAGRRVVAERALGVRAGRRPRSSARRACSLAARRKSREHDLCAAPLAVLELPGRRRGREGETTRTWLLCWGSSTGFWSRAAPASVALLDARVYEIAADENEIPRGGAKTRRLRVRAERARTGYGQSDPAAQRRCPLPRAEARSGREEG